MTVKTIYQFTCDICKKKEVEEYEVKYGSPNNIGVIPRNWSRLGNDVSILLCDGCTLSVMMLLDNRRKEK